MTVKGPKIIYGSVTFWGGDVDEAEKILKLLEELSVDKVDCAEGYGKAEETLGQTNATARFKVDTKASAAMGPELMTRDVVLRSARESLRRLNAESVDIYYLHAPDRRIPFEGSLAAIDILYREGAFQRFGLSNYLPHEVEEVIRICKENGYVLPSVFEGNYSPIARRPDAELFPILRKNNMAFYAYSPLAGGFLTKTKEMLMGGGGEGRWDPKSDLGKLYGGLYRKPGYLKALDIWDRIAHEEGVSKAELAYRWVAFNSCLRGDLGDGVIFGAYNERHLRETVAWLRKGPVSPQAAKSIDKVWAAVESESVWDNFNDYVENNRFKKIGEGW